MVGVASSVANDVIMRMGAATVQGYGATNESHNENDVTVTIASLRRYGSWRHVATGCTAVIK